MKNIPVLKQIMDLKFHHFHLDQFQKFILENIHLEFFLKKGRMILTPDYQVYFVSNEDISDEEYAQIESLKKEHRFLSKLKEYIIYNLAIYSALIETNSYFIENNNYLLICRFVPEANHKNHFELKVYTIHPDELPHNYKDKLYLGRDFVNVQSFTRKYLGILSIKNSLKEQLKKLENRLRAYTTKEIFSEIESEYTNEIKELISEIEEYVNVITSDYPEEISKKTIPENKLIQVNEIFREIKHVLIDIEDSIKELEDKLLESNLLKAAKYVIKFRKDIMNYTNYIIIKINGRISDAVNHIHL
ncbi:MAG: hypothetical protein NZ853_06270 [Leptospiraceae bacterium]|nr:hypothetical protein [Leptospiraceae bacterium]MDW7976443.1 hypothetical protein [Leptospiraceae bacterium]